jgi:hypothetical protein
MRRPLVGSIAVWLPMNLSWENRIDACARGDAASEPPVNDNKHSHHALAALVKALARSAASSRSSSPRTTMPVLEVRHEAP